MLLIAFMALIFNVCITVPKADNYKSVGAEIAPMADEIVKEYRVDSEGFSENSDTGIYITRPEHTSAYNVYYGTVSAETLKEGMINFYPDYEPIIFQNDTWQSLEDDTYFQIDEESDSTRVSVAWTLRETAPAAVYGIRCSYEITDEYGVEEVQEVIFKILYAGDWNYIKVTTDDGARRIENFSGGSELTLFLNVTFNDGASVSDLTSDDRANGEYYGVFYGNLKNSDIVSTRSMRNNIVVKTLSGKVYKNVEHDLDSNVNNRIKLRFLDPLEEDIYIVQITSDANGQIIGQFIIDNTNMKGGVNLSQLWVIFMVLGGVLAFGAASAYLVPLLIVKFNEARVYKENERVARMKNPEAYANKKKKSFKEMINKLIYNIKTPAYKRKKEKVEEAVPEDEKVYSNRFTEMLRERKEKRDFMREHNVTSDEMEEIKAREAALAADKANSFASLRDDDDNDEIATFHAAQEEISTLETGAYVDNGARFAKLDSLRDDESEQGDFTDGGSNSNGENN